jgi:hypothetical protein
VEGYKNGTMRDTDIAYIAGFVDGEGWVGVSRSKHNKYSRPSYSPLIRVTKTKRGILEWIQETLGCGFVCKGKRVKTENDRWKDSFMWTIGSRNIVRVTGLLMPYIQLKKRQLEIVTQIAKINLSLQKSPTGRRNPQPTERELARLWGELGKLNKRG